MKRYIIKTISLLLAATFLISSLCLAVSALTFKKGNNDVSDAYKESVYYENLTSLTLTGDGRTDVLAVALSQLGYTEGNSDGDFSGTSNGNNNFTEYNYNMGSFGYGYGGAEYPWCASFVSFCLLQAGIHSQNSISDWCRKNEGNAEYIWREVSCNKWATQLRACGFFEDSAYYSGSYTPLSGDLIFFCENGTLETHIGFVLYVEDNTVYTVEGNTNTSAGLVTNGGSVCIKNYDLRSSAIRGYGVLPYKINNKAPLIDYSGKLATTGTYVSNGLTYIYSTDTTNSYSHVLPKYSVFKVTEVTSNGRLKGEFNIDGEAVTGYVRNDDGKLIQFSSTEKLAGYNNAQKLPSYINSALYHYIVGSNYFPTREKLFEATESDAIKLRGWVGFTKEIKNFGYYFDGQSDNINIDYMAFVLTEDSILASGGKLASRYLINADTTSLTPGEHTVNFVVTLSDGSIAELGDMKFILRHKNGFIPSAPTISGFDKNSITLLPTTGYEYSLNGIDWQNNSVFTGLTDDRQYKFYQRVAQTDRYLASLASVPTTVHLRDLLASNKLAKLIIYNATLKENFDPNVTEYTVSVPYSTTSLEIKALANGTSTVTVSETELEAGKTTEIKITVTPPIGSPNVYIIKATRAAEETESKVETTAPTETTPPATDTESTTNTEFVDTNEPESTTNTDSTSDIIIETSENVDENTNNSYPIDGNNSCNSTLNGTLAFFLVLLVSLSTLPLKRKDN